MARKSIKGYAEKNYYDNTRFNGGILATHDPLNEGYFKHLVNFDISDMGQSLTPRKGFLTTTLKYNENIQTLSSDVIYFYDESLGQYIFVDFTKINNEVIPMWRVQFDIENNFIQNCIPIQNYEILNIDNIYNIKPIYTNQALRLKDEYFVTSYVIKVKTDTEFWIKLYYRENEHTSGDTTYSEDTLVIEYIDFDQVVEYVDTTKRNLASTQSIIPSPMQQVYNTISDIPLGHYDRLPMIYLKQNNKYLINTTQYIEGIEVIPNFYLNNTTNDYDWAYAYDVVSTESKYLYTDAKIYKSPIFYINNNKVVPNTTSSPLDTIMNKQIESYHTLGTSQGVSSVESYNNYLESLYIDVSESFIEDPDSYILYILPLPQSGTFETSCNINLKNSDLLGPYGLYTYLSDHLIYDDTEGDNTFESAIKHNEIVLNENYVFSPKYSIDLDESLTEGIYYNRYLWTYLSNINKIINSKYNNIELGICIQKVPLASCKKVYNKYLHEYVETFLLSNIHTFDPNSIIPLYNFLNNDQYSSDRNKLSNSSRIICKVLQRTSSINITGYPVSAVKDLQYIFPNLTENKLYVICTSEVNSIKNYHYKTILEALNDTNVLYNKMLFLSSTGLTTKPLLIYNKNYINNKIIYDRYDSESNANIEFNIHSMFTKGDKPHISADLTPSNDMYIKLKNAKYFDKGLLLNFYLLHMPSRSIMENEEEVITREQAILSTSLNISRSISIDSIEPSTYVEYLTEDPYRITRSVNSLIFNSTFGDHLVLYESNKLYVSKESMPYYFIEDNKKEYPEPIVKVLQYKDMLLVFTTQNLYAVYFYEDTINVSTTDEEGNLTTTQQKVYRLATLPVLYNLMVNEKYKDAIQVYNQMILFYSSDGQMFLIKPTAAIDSNTRFSIQYFNKSANDILLNYKDYMYERLKIYNINTDLSDVTIKVTANINYIKIFYTSENAKYTYVLIYDVLNNRYYSYDTLAFSNIESIQYIQSGELYISKYSVNEQEEYMYFTIPHTNIYEYDNNVDKSYYYNFDPMGIECEIDTGVLNLNNHLKKRFKDLHVIYKNLNANNLEFKLETFVDDLPIYTYVESSFDVRDISDYNTLITQDTVNVIKLIDNNALLNFSSYNSNKVLTHKSNIISKGKSIRIKMNFSSKGKYKIQGYGLIYKEHTV